MKRKTTPRGLKAVGLGVIGVSAWNPANATTEITFGGFTVNNTDISSIPGYGSNVSASSADYTVSLGAAGVTGTPDIALTWGVGYQTYTAWDGRGNVAQLDYNVQPGSIDLLFTPSAGAGVLLSSFSLDEWTGGGNMDVNWQVFDSIGVLASGNWTRNTGGRDTITTGLGVGDIRGGQAVTLRLTLNSGTTSYVALANLTFDQVPEPSSLALGLAGLGLGAVAMRRRRK